MLGDSRRTHHPPRQISPERDRPKPTSRDMPSDHPRAENQRDLVRSAVRKAYWRLMPLLFVCYVVAYVDRTNVSIAKLTMSQQLVGFTDKVIGFGAGVFFLGYFLLEVPGTLIVERWSARKWICRIMVTWGIVAALTAFVTKPWHFHLARFALGLSEAGFFPGVLVYLTHWFPTRDRARAFAGFLIASPIAQMISPKICNLMLPIGTTEVVTRSSATGAETVHTVAGSLATNLDSFGGEPVVRALVHPQLWGLDGWQWIYIGWGIPAILLGLLVLVWLTDRPGHARWLTAEEREALEAELAAEKAAKTAVHGHMSVLGALKDPRVLLLCTAFLFMCTGNYGIEIFMPSILKDIYKLSNDTLTWILIIPPLGSLVAQMFVGWNSDRTGERRWHTVVPMYAAAVSVGLMLIPGLPVAAMVVLLTVAAIGFKAYLPAFWALPNIFLAEAAAAGAVGLINSVGNLGGFIGPYTVGAIKDWSHSFLPALAVLCVCATVAGSLILALTGFARSPAPPLPAASREPEADLTARE
jgi:ACS family tartrate transporter-like MFS transporter